MEVSVDIKKGYYKYNFSLNQIILEITIDKVDK